MAHKLEEVRPWLKSMGDKGIYGATSARLRSTAIEQITSVLGEDEPKDVESVLANIRSIADRWATKNQANPDTAMTYLSKAKSTLQHYLRFQESPTTFSLSTKATKKTESKDSRMRSKGAPVKEAPSDPLGTTPPSGIPAGMRDYPLSKGTIIYRVPEGGITTRDTLKFALHLLTFASDFDPQTQAQMFALARTTEAA